MVNRHARDLWPGHLPISARAMVALTGCMLAGILISSCGSSDTHPTATPEAAATAPDQDAQPTAVPINTATTSPSPAPTNTRPPAPLPSPTGTATRVTTLPAVPETATATPSPPPPSPTSTPLPTRIPPTATQAPSATPPPPTPSRTPSAIAPTVKATATSETNGRGYRFLPAGPAQPDPSHPCPGCPHAPAYIAGHVIDAHGNPLAGVRLVCYNDWHRYPVVASKGGGEYDFVILQAEATWYVEVLDQSDQPISAPVPVAVDPAQSCWTILDWRRVD